MKNTSLWAGALILMFLQTATFSASESENKKAIHLLVGDAKAESRLFDSEVRDWPNQQYVALALDGDRKILVGLLTRKTRQISLIAKFVDSNPTNDVDVELEPSVLSTVKLDLADYPINDKRRAVAVRKFFTFDSETSHCGSELLSLYWPNNNELKLIFTTLVAHSCDEETNSNAEVSLSHESHLGFRDLIVRSGKKSKTYRWNGTLYALN